MKRPLEEDGEEKSPSKKKKKLQRKGSVGVELCCGHDGTQVCPYSPTDAVPLLSKEEKAEPPQAMNALMRLNQLKPGLQYKLVSQTGPVHAPIFTMAVEVDGSSFEASGPSKKTAKLHVAVKVCASAAPPKPPLPLSPGLLPWARPSQLLSHRSYRTWACPRVLKAETPAKATTRPRRRTPSRLWWPHRPCWKPPPRPAPPSPPTPPPR